MTEPISGSVGRDAAHTNLHVSRILNGCEETKIRARHIEACDAVFDNVTVRNSSNVFGGAASVVSAFGGVAPFFIFQTIPNNVPATVEFNVVESDPLGLWDQGSFAWRIRDDGVYTISFTLCFFPNAGTGNTGGVIQVTRGGAVAFDVGKDVRYTEDTPTNVTSPNNTVTWPLQAGDEVRIISAVVGIPAGLGLLSRASGSFPQSTNATHASLHRVA